MSNSEDSQALRDQCMLLRERSALLLERSKVHNEQDTTLTQQVTALLSASAQAVVRSEAITQKLDMQSAKPH